MLSSVWVVTSGPAQEPAKLLLQSMLIPAMPVKRLGHSQAFDWYAEFQVSAGRPDDGPGQSPHRDDEGRGGKPGATSGDRDLPPSRLWIPRGVSGNPPRCLPLHSREIDPQRLIFEVDRHHGKVDVPIRNVIKAVDLRQVALPVPDTAQDGSGLSPIVGNRR